MNASATLEAGITALIAASCGLYTGDTAKSQLQDLDKNLHAATGLNPKQVTAAAQAASQGNSETLYQHYAPNIDSHLSGVADCTIAASLVDLLSRYVQADQKTTEVKTQAEQASNALDQVHAEAGAKFNQVIEQAAAYIGNVCQALGGVNVLETPSVFGKIVQCGAQAIECAISTLSSICQQHNSTIRGIGEQLLQLLEHATTEIQDLLQPKKQAVIGAVALGAVAVAGGLLQFADCVEPAQNPPPEPENPPTPEPPPEPEKPHSPAPASKGIAKSELHQAQAAGFTPAKNEPVAPEPAPKHKPPPVAAARTEPAVQPSGEKPAAVAPAVSNDSIKPRKAGKW